MKRARDYMKSIPVRLAIAAAIIGGFFAVEHFSARSTATMISKEEPKPGTAGLSSAYQEGTDTALRVMVSQPLREDAK